MSEIEEKQVLAGWVSKAWEGQVERNKVLMLFLSPYLTVGGLCYFLYSGRDT
jgi:hypothetical protein